MKIINYQFQSYFFNFQLFLVKLVEISGKHMKNVKKIKNKPKQDKFEVPPQGVDQLLYVDQL